MIRAERAARIAAEAEATGAKADLTSTEALIAHLKLAIEKLRRALYGSRSERQARLLDQMELELEELEASASEDAIAAEKAALQAARAAPPRRRPARRPFPEHLPRERVVITAPTACPCCGSGRLSKLGEDVTETLEVIPRRFRVIETVRERFSCRDCERITQPPAPFHVVPRGLLGPQLLVMILFDKFAQHQPLNRQGERFAREGIALSVSTLADQVAPCAYPCGPSPARPARLSGPGSSPLQHIDNPSQRRRIHVGADGQPPPGAKVDLYQPGRLAAAPRSLCYGRLGRDLDGKEDGMRLGGTHPGQTTPCEQQARR